MDSVLVAEDEIDVKNGVSISSAIIPLLKLLSLTMFGLILAYPKTQLIPRAIFKILSKLVFAIFLPCTIFFHLGETITLANFLLWWFIPANVFISTAFGCVLGYLVAKICRPPPEFVRFTIIFTAFGNTGNLPLAIVGSVCHSPHTPFGPDCHRTGVAYVSFSQWVAVLLVYTIVYHMMEPPLEYYEVVDEGNETVEIQNNQEQLSRPLLLEAEWPGMEEKETVHCKTPLIARVFAISETSSPNLEFDNVSDSIELEEGDNSRPSAPLESIRCLAEPGVVKRIRVVAKQTPIKHILQPPTIATLLALIAGMFPPLKKIAFGEDAPLSFITDSLEILAEAMVPSVMLILGGMLAEGPNESRLGLRTTIGVIVARLFILPLIGMGVVGLAAKMNMLIVGDQMFKFVILLHYTCPSAILFGAIASLRGYAVCEASALLFWQHVVALFSISLYTILYFRFLRSYE